MALTIEDVRAPETSSSAPPPPAPHPPARSHRTVLSWVAVLAALVATGLFVRSALSSDDHDRRPAVVVRADTKDHPLYKPTAAVVVRADTKDHPRYNRTEVVSIVVPDVKDHPLYGR